MPTPQTLRHHPLRSLLSGIGSGILAALLALCLELILAGLGQWIHLFPSTSGNSLLQDSLLALLAIVGIEELCKYFTLEATSPWHRWIRIIGAATTFTCLESFAPLFFGHIPLLDFLPHFMTIWLLHSTTYAMIITWPWPVRTSALIINFILHSAFNISIAREFSLMPLLIFFMGILVALWLASHRRLEYTGDIAV